MDWIWTLSGFAVGFVVGMTGVGGGSLMTPVLILAFGVSPATAVGTDLLYAALTKTAGACVHGFKATVNWKIVGWLAAGSVPAALATIAALKSIDVNPEEFSTVISVTLGGVLILTAMALIFKDRIRGWAPKIEDQRTQFFATVSVGVLLGVLVTISSVGAGALGTVALLFLYPNLRTVNVVGTDIAHAIPLTLVAGLGHLTMGHVDFTLLGSLLLGSLPGVYLGSQLGGKIPERALQAGLAAVLATVGGKLVM